MAKFSIHKFKYSNYKPLFLILKSEVKQYLNTLINKKLLRVLIYVKIFIFLM